MSRPRRRRPAPLRARPGPRPGGSVTFSSQYNEHWRQDLERSNVFLALATPTWLRTPRLWDHVDYARQLGLPFRIALFPGTVIPDGLFAGVTDLEIQPCTTADDLEAYVLAVLEHGRGQPPPRAGEGQG